VQPAPEKIRMTPDVVRSAQQKLNDEGYESGTADGKMGPVTRGAIRKYQQDKGLKVTGTLDESTLSHLNVGGGKVMATAPGDIGRGAKAAGHDIKEGHPVAAGKAFGKGVGRAGKAVGEGTKSGVSEAGHKVAGEKKEESTQEKETQRLKDSYDVLHDILGMPDKGIPRDLLNKSECVIVVPSMKKAAFIVGASYGRGTMLCRSGEDFRGPWSAPAFFALEGGSFGLQVGGQATDYVILVMNEKGARSVMSSKVKLGGDASVAAGPVGRTTSAETDIVMKAEMLSWSRNRGIFAGISLQGSTIRSDDDANKNLYGKELDAKQIILQKEVKTPPAGEPLVKLLDNVSPQHL
jgi:lipid-binding SYLF domain-containing protein